MGACSTTERRQSAGRVAPTDDTADNVDTVDNDNNENDGASQKRPKSSRSEQAGVARTYVGVDEHRRDTYISYMSLDDAVSCLSSSSSSSDDEEDMDQHSSSADHFFPAHLRRQLQPTPVRVFVPDGKVSADSYMYFEWVAAECEVQCYPGFHPGFVFLTNVILRGDGVRACREYALLDTLESDRRPFYVPDATLLERDDDTPVYPGNFGEVFVGRWPLVKDERQKRGEDVFVKVQPSGAQFSAECAVLFLTGGAFLPTPKLVGLHVDSEEAFARRHAVYRERMDKWEAEAATLTDESNIYRHNVRKPKPVPPLGDTDRTTTVLELSAGQPADVVFAPGDPPSLHARLVSAAMFAFCLKCVHAQSIVHSDVALRNFMCNLSSRSTFQIVDFGLAVVMLPGVTSVPYPYQVIPAGQCAPETLQTRVVSYESDVFQFGWLLYELFSGEDFCKTRIMAHHGSMAQLREAVATLRPDVPAVDSFPAEVFDLAMRCLAVDPTARPSVDTIIAELCALVVSGEPELGALSDVLTAHDNARHAYAAFLSGGHVACAVLLSQSFGTPPVSIEQFVAVRDTSPAEADEDMTVYKQFWMSGKDFGDAGAIALSGALQVTKAIKELFLSQCAIGPLGGEALGKALARQQTVTSLDLAQNPLGPGGLAGLARALSTNTTLHTLSLRFCPIEDAVPLGSALAENRTLRRLFMPGCSLTDASGAAIAEGLASQTTQGEGVEELDLGSNKELGQATVNALASALGQNRALKSLALSSCTGLGDIGIAEIGRGVRGNITLETLGLCGCRPFNDDAEESLHVVWAETLTCADAPHIQVLDLSCLQLGGHAGSVLAQAAQAAPHLAELKLNDNMIDPVIAATFGDKVLVRSPWG